MSLLGSLFQAVVGATFGDVKNLQERSQRMSLSELSETYRRSSGGEKGLLRSILYNRYAKINTKDLQSLLLSATGEEKLMITKILKQRGR